MNANSIAVGSLVLPQAGTVPAANAAGARNGTGIDRFANGGRYDSCVLFAQSGAVTGAPSAQTLDAKLQDSADNSTFADITGAAITQITAASSSAKKNVNLSTAKRYIRVVETTGFTAGTSPTMGGATSVLLGGGDVLPVA